MAKTLIMGQRVATCGIIDAISENPQFGIDVLRAMQKYACLDWGDTCEEDARLNDEALENGDRIMAVYNTCKGKIWIITESDRSSTTVLFPSEY